jgi:hypothetical protein
MNYHDVMENVKKRAEEMLFNKQKPPQVEIRDPQNDAIRQAYVELMSMPAWKDFMAILEEVKNMPLQLLDEKAVGEVSLIDAGFIKGVRSAVKTIQQKIQAKIK